MWRHCDLHTHTSPNERCDEAWDVAATLAHFAEYGLNVLAITDHDVASRCSEVVAAAPEHGIEAVAGAEVSTDRGHVVVLAPGSDGSETISRFLTRIGAEPNKQVALEALLNVAEDGHAGDLVFRDRLVIFGAHVDKPGSLLASNQTLNVEAQLALAMRFDALEVTSDEVIRNWLTGGVKQGPKMTLIKSSDSHDLGADAVRATWVYLPEVTAQSLQHAFAVPEACVRLDAEPPTEPDYAIESIRFIGGLHDGLQFSFDIRANAIIGPPNTGKSLVVDAIKFVFGLQSQIAEVEETSRSRMEKCLPAGCSVEISVRTPTGTQPLTRTIGSAQPPPAPFIPIVFSQTELLRRAMASKPSVELIDLHVAEGTELKASVREASEEIQRQFVALLEDAARAARLRTSVANTVDGLAATRQELEEIAGAESIARKANDATTVAAWRSDFRTAVRVWRDSAILPELAIPGVPESDESNSEAPADGDDADLENEGNSTDLKLFLPSGRVDTALQAAKERVAHVVDETADELLAILDRDEVGFEESRQRIESELEAAGFEVGSEVERRLSELRTRLQRLQREEGELSELDKGIDSALAALSSAFKRAEEARSGLTLARRQTCTRVNESMRTFFARIDANIVTGDLDDLIGELSRGTYLRDAPRTALRDNLDRFRLMEEAVTQTRGHGVSSSSDQDRMVAEAVTRSQAHRLADLACTWAEDALELAQHGSPNPTSFSDLTEGLRALAIKEISFADSDLPVVTDQPEDAVPTRAVFQNLVPTLRRQRAHRQFIVVSHDANIVVASDMERITVLGANEDGSPHVGDLFDSRVRKAALEHLEGGSDAFSLRASRYATFRS